MERLAPTGHVRHLTGMTLALTVFAIAAAGVTLYFVAFWSAFAFWRRHPVLAYTMMLGTLGGGVVAAYAWRAQLLAVTIAMPGFVRVSGWLLVIAACVFTTIADRQIGFRVRSFMPFFEEHGRIELVTTGAYGVVRHPIYAGGIAFQLGIFLATGHVAVAIACVVFALGAVWFTRQEERRLVELLDDPAAYERYRAHVPALVPGLGGRSRRV